MKTLNRNVDHNKKLGGMDLLNETLSSDPIVERLRVHLQQCPKYRYHDTLSKNTAGAAEAQKAFASSSEKSRFNAFAEAVQIMLGGDEVYVALHPLFAPYISKIIGELDQTAYTLDRNLNIASVTLSKAEKVVDPKQQRAKPRRGRIRKH